MRKLSLLTLALLALLCLGGSAKADTTYVYDGLAFDQLVGVTCPPICHITGYITLASAIAPNSLYQSNSQGQFPGPAPLDFSFDGGFGAVTLANSFQWSFQLGTDASGNFAIWSGGASILTALTGGCATNIGFSFNTEAAGNAADVNCFDADNNLISQKLGQSVVTTTTPPGEWSVSSGNPTSTPEPSSLALVALGLGGILLLTRKLS